MIPAARTIALMFIVGLDIRSQVFQECPTNDGGPPLHRFEYSQLHMGGRVDLALYAPDRQTAERAAKAAFARFAELEQIMSDYRPNSELNLLCDAAASGPVRISVDLAKVLRRAEEVSGRSNGAFDVTCGPLIRLWRETRRTGRLPSAEALGAARAMVGWRRLRLDPGKRTAGVEPGVRIDLGGIAKGYACDEALRAMRRQGVSRGLVRAGGDIAVSDAPPEVQGWTIAILGLPGPPLVLRNAAVSTSGDAEQHVEIGGVRYSHVVDPRTGIGVTSRAQATVVARDGLTADPLATAACVLGREDAERLVALYRARARFVLPKG